MFHGSLCLARQTFETGNLTVLPETLQDRVQVASKRHRILRLLDENHAKGVLLKLRNLDHKFASVAAVKELVEDNRRVFKTLFYI